MLTMMITSMGVMIVVSIIARPVRKTAAGINGGNAKTGKRGGETTAGIAKTGSKRGGKISDGGSPAMHTRKRLYQALTEAGEAVKRKG